ncbi:MAG: histidine--tRNA ligase [Chloroflexi bacterium]|jgi:histidyl-tRNA synthetase|nr:histidine--tRNA ligase [Chloroflexota bacterium]
MKQLIQSVKGTRDFYPEEMSIRTWLYQKINEVSSSFGYEEYEGPILERLELYAAKSGEELVKEQSFVFSDRGGDQITLRPELTPTLARMIAQRQSELVFPVRWWSFGPFWRYEKPQKGRTREFFQWNCDILGVNSPEADAELVAVAASFLRSVGLTPSEVKIYVNNRRLMDALIGELGVEPENRKNIFHIIDRRDKLSAAAWKDYALESGLSEKQFEALCSLLEDKNLWKRSDELIRFFNILKAMKLDDFVVFDPQVIRGLEYYTGTVFEGRDASGEGRAVFGGGRYDNLVGDVGGDPLPGVGFAMGDVMITVLLQKYGKIDIESKREQYTVLVTVFDETLLPASFAIGNDLRNAGLRVVTYPEAAKLPKQLKFADRKGIHFAVIQGPDEATSNSVTIKDLLKREQKTVPLSEAAKTIKEMMQ